MSAAPLSTLSIQTPDMLRYVVAANDATMSPIVNLGEHESAWPRDGDSPHEESAATAEAATAHADPAVLHALDADGVDDDGDDPFGPPDAAQGTRPPSPIVADVTSLNQSLPKQKEATVASTAAEPGKRRRLFSCLRPCCAPPAEPATTCDREVTSHLRCLKQHVVRAIIALTEPLAGASVRAVDVQSRSERTFQ